MADCLHRKSIIVRGGTLRPDERRAPYEAAWCRNCGAFREESATSSPEKWQKPKKESNGTAPK
jgi:hypothetical protein